MYEVLTYSSETDVSFLEKVDVPYEEACKYVCGLLVAAKNNDPEHYINMTASADNGGACVYSGVARFNSYVMTVKLYSEALLPLYDVPATFSDEAEELFKSGCLKGGKNE